MQNKNKNQRIETTVCSVNNKIKSNRFVGYTMLRFYKHTSLYTVYRKSDCCKVDHNAVPSNLECKDIVQFLKSKLHHFYLSTQILL